MNALIKEILSIGKPMNETGINNWSLTRAQALSILDEIYDKNIAVLGGDLYELIDECLKPSYIDWYCNIEDGENTDSYVLRSIKEARNFVEKYGYEYCNKYQFVFTLKPLN